MDGGGAAKCAVLVMAATVAAACGARLPARPTGPTAPAPDAAAHFERITSHCAGLRTMTAELGLSGRAGDARLRGRVITGLQRGGDVRLEGIAPFGAPVFILAARSEQATLLLPRDRRVLDGVPVAQVIERLTGVPLGADDLLHTLTGCLGAGAASNGRQWSGGWEAVDVPGARTVLLRSTGRDATPPASTWVIAAVEGGGWRTDYALVQNGIPREVRLRSEDGRVDLIATVQQLEVNTAIDAAAFRVNVPADSDPMTLDELRSVAPLRTP